jgi:hypothetical protein
VRDGAKRSIVAAVADLMAVVNEAMCKDYAPAIRAQLENANLLLYERLVPRSTPEELAAWRAERRAEWKATKRTRRKIRRLLNKMPEQAAARFLEQLHPSDW